MERAEGEVVCQEVWLSIISKMQKKVRWTVTCDKVVLHDDWSPYAGFTIVPYFAYFRRGRPFGMVRNLLSPQEQLNKIGSQELHIVNTTANPVSAPCSSKSSGVIPTKDPDSTIQPLLAVVFTICSS